MDEIIKLLGYLGVFPYLTFGLILLTTGYFRDNITCHFCASMISGFVTTASSLPLDIAKTRIQNMRTIDGIPEYKGVLVSIALFTSSVHHLHKKGSYSISMCCFDVGLHTFATLIKTGNSGCKSRLLTPFLCNAKGCDGTS